MGQGVEAFLEAIELNRRVQPAAAEEVFRAAITELSSAEIDRLSAEIDAALASFLKRRRRILTEFVQQVLARVPVEAAITDAAPPPVERGAPKPEVAATVRATPAIMAGHRTHRPASEGLTYNKERLSADLEDLSNHHIFQWATFYRETLSQYFDAYLEALGTSDRPWEWLNLVKAALSHHASEIFSRGYGYQTRQHQATPHYAITKSLSGLQRFLDLPLEFYSARLAVSQHSGSGLSLRQLASAMVSGILIGYSHARFDVSGYKILPRFPGSWFYVLPFLTADDLREVCAELERGDLVDGIHESVLPFAKAIDVLAHKDRSTYPLPALSQFTEDSRRLEIQLQFAPDAAILRRVEVHCYTSGRFFDRSLIEQAASRGVGAVLAPLRADLRVQLMNVERFSDIIVPTIGAEGDEPHVRLVARLEDHFYDSPGASSNRIIDFNYAAQFPLESPFLTRYSHVYRTSVRRLMQDFERRNGVRLWCSVRRSGKTTACASDLGSTTSQTTVLPQTCDQTGQIREGDVFMKAVRHALDSGTRLPDDFVAATVAECLQSENDKRVVLVLDEYETLFGELKAAMEKDGGIRYLVVQPLLNQLVAFTRENLLIFMGQQPDAHWILMDQNQLSPVVMQDNFPLFARDKASRSLDEFEELLQKMMSSHVRLEQEFVDAVYAETGGHPFLTGKMLVAFWDWLIEKRFPTSALSPARADLFNDFASERLTARSIAYNERYKMFKRAASDHLSPLGRVKDPWLHSVYSAMRSLVLNSPATYAIPETQFEEMAERYSSSMSPHELLASASQANFLTLEDGLVRPKIRVLARIAAAVKPMNGAA